MEATGMRTIASRTFRAFDVIGRLLKELAVRELDFALLVQADDDDFHRIADFAEVIGIVDVFPIETANVAETIGITEEVHERAIFFNAGDFAFVDFADFRFADDVIDHGRGQGR